LITRRLIENMIPENETGVQTNTESSVEFSDEAKAKEFYEVVKNRLLQVNQWQELAGPLSAEFQLTDESGRPVSRWAQAGDHIRIDIPGPRSVRGDGNDWVQIEEINEAKDCVSIHVRPAPNPLDENEEVAHFFSDEASSSFIVKRESNKVTAGVYGRNEKPNTDAKGLIDKLRNTIVAAGAITGFSKMQWKKLVEGMVAG